MKKTLLLLAVALLGCSAMNAQFKKSWDFTKGLSEETVANLNADATNWSSNGTDGEGTTNNWKNNTKVDASSYLKANGEVIPEMEGLYINIGSNGANSIHLAQNKIRLTRKNTIITFPKLANGQTITVRARSANATATNRGFIANSSNLVYISGPAGGTCLGNQVEGATPDEDGNYTLIWQVQTEETDSVEVSLKLSPEGGLDIASFMIDNGDAPVIEEDPSVAYVYSGDPDADNFRQYAGLDDYTTVTNIAVSELLEGSVSVDSIESFDLVVLPKSAYEPEGAAAYLKERRNHVPMLDLSVPSYYQPVNNVSTIKVFEGYLDSEWFEGLEYSGENDDELQLFNGETGAYGIEYAFPENGVYSGDVLATTGDAYTLYIYGKKNTYMNFPLDDEQIVADGDLNLTETGMALISNIVKCLKNTKATVVEAAKPTVKTVYEDGVSTVSLSTSIPNATIYYTVDGSEPNVESEIYLGSLAFTQPATLKAIVVAPAYYNSAVLEEQVIIKTQLAMPSVSVAESDGFTTITLSAAEGASVYYSFNGITTAADAAAYSEPVVITEPATIYAFASSETMLPSEMMIRDVRVGGIPSVKDTVAHFTANENDWFTNVAFYNYNMEAQDVPTENWAAKAAYYWGKSAWNYYGTEIDHTETVYEEDGVTPVKCADGVTDSIKTVYKADPAAVQYVYSTTD
ncbi:MAG: chitobiase/beta-hexosaminidase C-terminal domain-containing protein, partial [Bacteroidales bacterium]|nr:chitobiase/beta-hexosaminidase C-terminal domain-containing protein [Bacteroidales bacterium]